MKILYPITIILLAIGIGSFASSPNGDPDNSSIEKEIWQLEEKYWEFWINKDIEGYMSLLHEDFLGWPSSLAQPDGKKAARGFVRNLWDQMEIFAYEMIPAGIRIIGSTAIVYYNLILKDKDGRQTGSRYRLTHTWIKQDGQWLVAGGMSSADSGSVR